MTQLNTHTFLYVYTHPRNIVSFIGLFCKRDLYTHPLYVCSHRTQTDCAWSIAQRANPGIDLLIHSRLIQGYSFLYINTHTFLYTHTPAFVFTHDATNCAWYCAAHEPGDWVNSRPRGALFGRANVGSGFFSGWSGRASAEQIVRISLSRIRCVACSHELSRGGGLGSRPKKMYGERLGDGVEYHLMKPTPRR